jgi:hypothetical protein
MDVSGNRCAGEEFAQDGDSTGLLVLVEREQFDTGVRARLPGVLMD